MDNGRYSICPELFPGMNWLAKEYHMRDHMHVNL